MSSKASKLRYQQLLEDFLAEREWEDELKIHEEEEFVVLVSGINLGENGACKLIVEASDRTDIVGVFFYFPFECKESKRSEMLILLNELNTRGYGQGGYGCFQLMDDGRVRWVQKVDFEGSTPTGRSIEQIVGPGTDRLAECIDAICAVALTKETAASAIQELDAEGTSDEAPSEL